MLNVSRTLILLGLSMAGVCYSGEQASSPAPATSSTEPASVSYQDLPSQNSEGSISQDNASETDKASDPVEAPAQPKKKLQLKSARSIKKTDMVSESSNIEDPAKLRAEGERQHSKGVTMQIIGAVMVPAGIALIVMNFEGSRDYEDGETKGNGGAYALTLLGDVVATAGVVGIVVGGVMRKSGTRKIRLADDAEKLSFRERHNIMVLPVANIENRAGGLVVAGTF